MYANTQSKAYQEARHELALGLMEVGAILTSESDHSRVIEREGPEGKERGFRLKLHEENPEAPLSPIFFNLRTPDNPKPGPLTPEFVRLAASCMRGIQLENEVECDAVVGVPWAGDPFAKELAAFMGFTCLSMVKWECGGRRCIARLSDPIPATITRVLLVDDLISGADSKIEAIQNLREDGVEVADVMVLVDREQGGRKRLEERSCVLHSVFTISELLNFYVFAGTISARLCTNILEYLGQAA